MGLPSLTLLATEALVKDEAVGWLAGELTEARTRSTSVRRRPHAAGLSSSAVRQPTTVCCVAVPERARACRTTPHALRMLQSFNGLEFFISSSDIISLTQEYGVSYRRVAPVCGGPACTLAALLLRICAPACRAPLAEGDPAQLLPAGAQTWCSR